MDSLPQPFLLQLFPLHQKRYEQARLRVLRGSKGVEADCPVGQCPDGYPRGDLQLERCTIYVVESKSNVRDF